MFRIVHTRAAVAKGLFTLLLLTLFSHTAAAQKNYTLEVGQSTYTDLVNPVVFSTPDEIKPFYLVNVTDFNFTAYGTKLGFDVTSTNGQGTLLSIEGYVAANMIPANDSIVSFHAFLCNNFQRRDETSSISVTQEGTPGDQILKFQWKNFGFIGHAESDFVNFQLWFHERGNLISYHYGPSQITSKIAFKGAGGPVVGLSQANWPAFDRFYKSDYLAGKSTNPTIGHPPELNTALSDVPTNGTVFTFRPAGSASVRSLSTQTGAQLYPQPFTDVLHCKFSTQGEKQTLVLYNVMGKEVKRSTGIGTISMDRSGLEPGAYFYRIVSASSNVVASGTIIAR